MPDPEKPEKLTNADNKSTAPESISDNDGSAPSDVITPKGDATTPDRKKRKKLSPSKAKPVKSKAKNKRPVKPKKPFPSFSLERALQIPLAIKEKNGGNPWASGEVAAAVGMGPRSSDFFYLTAAARDFGMTSGTRDTAKIGLTDLGREIVYAPNPQAERQKLKEAFHKIPLFSKVLSHYKGSVLPEMKYLANTLFSDFDLAYEFHQEFSKLFRENCEFLDIDSGDSIVGPGRPSTVIVGEPSKATSLKAFVIMPFVEKSEARHPGFFREVLTSLITPAGTEAGFVVETANRQGSDVIQSTIINELLDADLVIADLTDHNPNVLFELGLRMAEGRPVALIKSSDTGRLFDVDNMLRVFEYSPNLWRSTVESDLPNLIQHLKSTWENKNTDQSYMKILRNKPDQN